MRSAILIVNGIVLTASLVACGGGGGGASSPPPPTPAQQLASTTSTYLHYSNALPASPTTVAGTLTTIDPAAPTVTSNTNAALVGSLPPVGVVPPRVDVVYAASVSGENFSNYHRHAVVFVSAATGTLMKQSAVPSGATLPAAVQFSSASGISTGPGDGSVNANATDFCGGAIETDYQNPDNSIVLGRQAGPNSTCDIGGTSDDVGFWTRLGATSTTAPTPYPAAGTLPRMRIPLYAANGAITGFIVVDTTNTTTNNLVHLDANLANPAAVTNGPTGVLGILWLARNPATGVSLINVLTASSSDIYTYDPATNTLGASSLASLGLPRMLQLYVADASDLYFADFVNQTVLQKISVTSPAAATVAATLATGPVSIRGLFNTPTRIAYVVVDQGAPIWTYQLRSTAKSAAAPTNTTSTAVYPSTPTTSFIAVAGVTNSGGLYLNDDNGGGVYTAIGVNDDGTGLVSIADSRWEWTFLNTTYTTPVRYTARAVLLQRATAGATTDAGGSLKTYDSPTGAVVATFASTVPGDVTSLAVGSSGAGPRTLVSGTTATGVDQFYLDATAGTFTRVTTGASTVPLN